ncbi:MAG: glycosyltransferase family 2 protein [Prevotella sp.]|jgi:GT2 family glycosyltransferase|nr:glycosyltransferase family 2 protein [Prevotella sp.]
METFNRKKGVQVSVIIVNYNTAALLDECIESVIQKTEGVSYEIIVVDNRSEAGSLDSLVGKYQDVHFLFSGENLGFGKANNWGGKESNGKYLFFLNPDTLLVNNAIAILYEYMRQHPEAGICGGNLYSENMKPASSYYDTDMLAYEYKILLNRERKPGFNKTGQPKDVNVIVGADLFISKQLFDEQNGFDPDFFMYFEEVELCNRIQNKGYKIVSVPQAKIIHKQGGSAENKNDELKKWSYEEHWYSKLVYFSKTKGELQIPMLYCASFLKLLAGKLFARLKKNKTKQEYWEYKAGVMKEAYKRYKTYLANSCCNKTTVFYRQYFLHFSLTSLQKREVFYFTYYQPFTQSLCVFPSPIWRGAGG